MLTAPGLSARGDVTPGLAENRRNFSSAAAPPAAAQPPGCCPQLSVPSGCRVLLFPSLFSSFNPWQPAACSQVAAGAEEQEQDESPVAVPLGCCGAELQKVLIFVNQPLGQSEKPLVFYYYHYCYFLKALAAQTGL